MRFRFVITAAVLPLLRQLPTPQLLHMSYEEIQEQALNLVAMNILRCQIQVFLHSSEQYNSLETF